MPAIRPMTIGFIVVLTSATGAYAQGTTPPTGQVPPPTSPPAQTTAQDVTYKETVVVSASKTEQQIVDAPATMTVIGPRALHNVNLTAGVKFSGGRYSAALKIVNLGNEEVQQHVFGDVLKRQIMVEVKMALRKM